MEAKANLLEVEGLTIRYPGRAAQKKPPTVNDVSLSVKQGETFALVGESGSGKTTIARSILGLVPPAEGRITLDGLDITHKRSFSAVSLDLQAVFQDPFASLNPRKTVGASLRRPLQAQKRILKDEARSRIQRALTSVGLPPDSAERYPSMFSGGQRQRIAIARALMLEPKLIVCDEPTSALDVTTQASILGLLRELQERLGASYLFITHDLAVVRNFSDRVAVLYAGQIMETGKAADVCTAPTHPYTKRLLMSAPVPDPELQRQRRLERKALADEYAAPQAVVA